MVAVAAAVSRPRGRRWRRARRLRHIRRARRGLKFVGVVASRRTARVVVVGGRSLRAAAVTSTAADKHAADYGRRRGRQPKRWSDAHSDARSMRSRVASFETDRIQQAMERARM